MQNIDNEIASKIAERYGATYDAEKRQLTLDENVHDEGQEIYGIYTALLFANAFGNGRSSTGTPLMDVVVVETGEKVIVQFR